MIRDYQEKVKRIFNQSQHDFYIAALIFLTGLIGFGLGRLTILWPRKEPLQIMESGKVPRAASNTVSRGTKEFAGVIQASSGKFVASKSGSVYHLPGCPGAQKIKAENKLWFQTKEEAEALGLRPAANCDGL